MDIDKLNETLDLAEGLQNYKLTIITGRDRDSDGELTKETFKANNAVDAVLKVLKEYNTCCSGWFNGDYTEDELDETEKARNEKLYAAAESGDDQEECLKILSDLYDESMDITDYYDDIITIEGPNGIVFEDDKIDITGWFEDEEEIEDEGVDYKKDPKKEQINRQIIATNLEKFEQGLDDFISKGMELYLTRREEQNFSYGPRLDGYLSIKNNDDFSNTLGEISIQCKENQYSCNLFMDKQNINRSELTLDELLDIIEKNYKALLEHNKRVK